MNLVSFLFVHMFPVLINKWLWDVFISLIVLSSDLYLNHRTAYFVLLAIQICWTVQSTTYS